MPKVYEKQREEVISDLSDMSEIAEEMLHNSIKALNNKDSNLAWEVIERDDVLDNIQFTIEDKVARMLSEDNNHTSDIRFGLASSKIAINLERIGDHATNIAETVMELKNEEYIEPLVMIPELAEIVSDMLSAVLESFITRNADLAEAACRKDERADNIYDQLYEKSIVLLDDCDGERKMNQVVRFINVAKSLERVGDHATNIGEETIFIVTGNRVKY